MPLVTMPDGVVVDMPDDLTPELAARLRSLNDSSEQKPTGIAGKINAFSNNLLGNAPSEFASSILHNVQKPIHGIANTIQQGVAGLALAAAPNSKFAQGLGDQAMADEATVKQWEDDYQKRVPDSAASYAGATIGSAIPFAGSGVVSGLKSIGEAGGSLVNAVGLGGKLASKDTKILGRFAAKATQAVGSGAAQGAAIGAATSPNLESLPDSASTGAEIGAALSIAGIPLKYLGGKLYDITTGNIFELQGKKILALSIGKDSASIESAKKILASSTDDLTAAQAMSGNTRQEVQALGKFAGEYNPNVLGKGGSKIVEQNAARQQELAGLSGGAAQESSRAVQKEGVETLRLTLDPQRVEALDRADIGNKTIPKLEQELAQKTESLLYAMKDAGQLHTLAKQQIAQGDETLARDLGWAGNVKVQRHYDVAQQAQSGAEDAAAIFNLRKAEGDVIQAQIGSLEENGIQKIDHQEILSELKKAYNDVGTSSESRKAIGKIAQLTKDAVDRNGGTLSPYDMHTIRKEDMSNIIAKMVNKSGNVSGEVIGKMASVKSLFDQAIEKAGGTGWIDYLDRYANGMKELNKWKMGSVAQDLLENNPKKLVRLVNGQAPKTVEKVFGKGNFSFNDMMGDSAQPIINVAKKVENDLSMKSSADNASKTFYGRVIPDSRVGFKIPAFLSKATTIANAAIDVAETKLTTRGVDVVSKAMESPSQALKLLNTLTGQEKLEAQNFLISRGVIQQGMQRSMLSGSEQ